MGAQFDSETLKMRVGRNLWDVLNEALKAKGRSDRVNSEAGLFIITGLTVKSIIGDEVLLEVEYEFGG